MTNPEPARHRRELLWWRLGFFALDVALGIGCTYVAVDNFRTGDYLAAVVAAAVALVLCVTGVRVMLTLERP